MLVEVTNKNEVVRERIFKFTCHHCIFKRLGGSTQHGIAAARHVIPMPQQTWSFLVRQIRHEMMFFALWKVKLTVMLLWIINNWPMWCTKARSTPQEENIYRAIRRVGNCKAVPPDQNSLARMKHIVAKPTRRINIGRRQYLLFLKQRFHVWCYVTAALLGDDWYSLIW